MRMKLMILKAAGKLAAMNTAFQFPLLDLPNEIVAHIIEQVDSRKSLRALSRTCRRVQELTEGVLYRYALIRDAAQTRAVLRALHRRPARACAVRQLDVPCNWRCDQDLAGVAALLESAVGLRRLMIESPECNNGEFEEADVYALMAATLLRPFQRAVAGAGGRSRRSQRGAKALQRLEELVLHLNGPESPYWTIDERSICLFLLPSLQRLKLSCVNIEDDVGKGIERTAFTSLKHLALEEANVTHRGLRAILSLPKALETLCLGENCHNVHNFDEDVNPAANHLFSNDPSAVLEALRQQKDSLKSLVYVTPARTSGYRRKTPQQSAVDAGFADFPALESITLHGRCPNFERAVLSSKSPPTLKVLEYKTDNISWPPHERPKSPVDGAVCQYSDTIPFLRAPSSSIPPSLTTLRIVGHRQGVTDSIRNHVVAVAAEIKKMGIRLEVQFEASSPYFPPYLYGEVLPTATTVFDGQWMEAATDPPASWWASVED